MLRTLLIALCLSVLSVRSVEAQALTPPLPETELDAPDELSIDRRLGSRGAEYGGAIAGEGVMFVASAAVFILSWGGNARLETSESLMLVQTLRPLIVGGMVSAYGDRTGGQGRSGMAMLGALPGTALLVAGFGLASMDEGPGGALPILWVTGHISTVIGAVAAYRHSASHRPRLEGLTPSAFVDRERETVGVSLSGRF